MNANFTAKICTLSILLFSASLLLKAQTIESETEFEKREMVVFKVTNPKTDPVKVKQAEELAKKFLAAMLSNDSSIKEMIGYPFAFDKKAVLTDFSQVQEAFGLAKKEQGYSKGQIDSMMKKTKIKFYKHQCEIIDYTIAVDNFIIGAEIEGEGAAITVSLHPEMRVTGFGD